MTSASRSASPWPVPAATVPLACSCDDLRRTEWRLQALAGQCDERFDRLQRAFEQLPAAAAFDPFAVAAPAPAAGAAMAAASAPRSNGRARLPADALRPASASPASGDRVGAAPREVQRALQAPVAPSGDNGQGLAAARVGAAGRRSGASSGRPAAADAPGASLGGEAADAQTPSRAGWLGALGGLAVLGGEQVALLMQRHAAPALTVGLGGALVAALAGDGEREPRADVRRRHEGAGDLGAAAGSESARAQRPAAPTPPPGAAQHPSTRLAQDLGEAFAAVGWPEAPRLPARPAGRADSDLATLPQLLEQLLAQGLGGAVAGARGVSGAPGQPARQPAARAASRLVGVQPAAPSDRDRVPRPDAPAAAPLDALDAGEAMAQQISRLLLDQAWMRGVDLR